jgi:hypothetical protein
MQLIICNMTGDDITVFYYLIHLYTINTLTIVSTADGKGLVGMYMSIFLLGNTFVFPAFNHDFIIIASSYY